jgi:magnesium-dependent phosphatase 1
MDEGEWPSLIVFDLDFTLWDCGGTWCDCLRPPFARSGNRVSDANRALIRLYPDVPGLLQRLTAQGCSLAIASRTEQPRWAETLLDLLRIREVFAYQEIYPSDKQQHFQRLREASGVSFEEMLFFDDEFRNIRSVGSLGVTCLEVSRGVDEDLFAHGVKRWRRERGH